MHTLAAQLFDKLMRSYVNSNLQMCDFMKETLLTINTTKYLNYEFLVVFGG